MPRFKPGRFLNFQEIEYGLSEHYHESIKQRSLELDLGSVEWISILSVCTLFTWCREVLAKTGTVILFPPAGRSFASYVFNAANLLPPLESLGVKVVRDSRYSARDYHARLAAFNVFNNPEEVTKHIRALSDQENAQLLLHASELPEIVNSGDFARTALRELLENSFTHGASPDPHYGVIEVEPSRTPRKEHPVFSGFDSQAYLEICVADFSMSDIVDTLRDFLPEDYEPRGHRVFKKPLTTEQRCLFYAFEYKSTSKPERRKEKILRLLRDSSSEVQSIATGLYDVSALARYYEGQVIFRVKGLVGTIDYSRSRLRPRLYISDRVRRRKLIQLQGSMVLLRVPSQTIATERVISAPPKLPTKREPISSIKLTVIPRLNNARTRDDVTAALELEGEYLEELDKPVPRAVTLGEAKTELIAILLDGLNLGSKAFGALLMLLARAPRRKQGLIIVVDDSVKVSLAEEQWARCKDDTGSLGGWSRLPSLVVASDSNAATTVFGAEEHPEATRVDGSSLYFTGIGLELELPEVLLEIRRKRLEKSLMAPSVCHQDSLYLIESAYYTPYFFEVRKLLANESSRRTLIYWLQGMIQRLRPSSILINVDFLHDMVEELRLSESGRSIRIVGIEDSNPVKAVLATSAQREDRICVLLDVMCTGRFINEFLDIVPAPARVSIISLVDARASERSFIPISRSEGTVDIPVFSLLRHPISVLLDRPESTDIREIVVVDPVTHSPTKYPIPERSELEIGDFLRAAERSGGLAGGHFLYGQQHYVYFFSFSTIFREIRSDLEVFFLEGARELIGQPGVEAHRVRPFCLDENSGLFEVFVEALRDTDFPVPEVIEKKDLVAPPVKGVEPNDVVWFVLPAMTTGKTLRRAIEYAQALNTKHVRVDVIVARIEPDRHLFYQNLRRYVEMTLRVRFLCSLPLLAYPESRCPICALRERFSGILGALGHGHPSLRKLIEERLADLMPVPAKSAEHLGLEATSVVYEGLWLEALTRKEFEASDRDPSTRSKLMRSLEEKEEVEALVAAVGREPTARVFSRDRSSRILYSPQKIEVACKSWCARGTHDRRVFERQLRGFGQLTPEALREGLPQLFTRYRNDSHFMAALLSEAVRKPDLYFDAVETCEPSEDGDLANAHHDLREYLRRGASGEMAAPLFALHEVRWHLARSTAWGMTLEMLRIKLGLGSGDLQSVRDAYDRFVRDGFNDAERRLNVARACGTLWHRLPNYWGKIEKQWKRVAESVKELETAIGMDDLESLGDLHGSSLFSKIRYIEGEARTLIKDIDRIALRAGPAMTKVRELSEQSPRTRGSFEVIVDPSCPAIAMDEDDFIELILLILENAVERDSSGISTFSFLPVEASPLVLLTVTQQEPWVLTNNLEGGFARMRDILTHYGSTLGLELEASEGEPFMSIRFLGWPIGREVIT